MVKGWSESVNECGSTGAMSEKEQSRRKDEGVLYCRWRIYNGLINGGLSE